MWIDLVRLAWLNMRRARLRLLMTAAGVLVGTAAVVLLVALTIGLQQVAESSVGGNSILTEIMVFPSTESTFEETRSLLNAAAVAQFSALQGIRTAVPLLSLAARSEVLAGEYSNFVEIYGIPPEGLAEMPLQAASGTLTLESGQAIFGAAVPLYFVDPTAAEFIPVEIDVFNTNFSLQLSRMDGTGRSLPFTVNAVLQADTSRFDNAAFLPFDDVLDALIWSSGTNPDPQTLEYTQVLVRAVSREATNPLRDSIRELGYATDSIGDFVDELNSFFITMRLVLGATGGIALLVAAIVVANTMMMSVLERTQEIGVMKAIGARDRDVLFVFLLESALVGLVGGAGGVLLAHLLGSLLNDAILNSAQSSTAQLGFLPINPAMIQNALIIIPDALSVLALLIAAAVGTLAGLFPAWRAARLSPVRALRK